LGSIIATPYSESTNVTLILNPSFFSVNYLFTGSYSFKVMPNVKKPASMMIFS
jgi:hypothetical protein